MMRFFTAHVRDGRLILDEPTEHPDGTLVELVPTDSVMWLVPLGEVPSPDDEPVDESAASPSMQPLRAHARDGRLVLAEPTDLPDGTGVELVSIDDVVATGGYLMDDETRAVFAQELEASFADEDAGQLIDAADALADLKAHRKKLVNTAMAGCRSSDCSPEGGGNLDQLAGAGAAVGARGCRARGPGARPRVTRLGGDHDGGGAGPHQELGRFAEGGGKRRWSWTCCSRQGAAATSNAPARRRPPRAGARTARRHPLGGDRGGAGAHKELGRGESRRRRRPRRCRTSSAMYTGGHRPRGRSRRRCRCRGSRRRRDPRRHRARADRRRAPRHRRPRPPVGQRPAARGGDQEQRRASRDVRE